MSHCGQYELTKWYGGQGSWAKEKKAQSLAQGRQHHILLKPCSTWDSVYLGRVSFHQDTGCLERPLKTCWIKQRRRKESTRRHSVLRRRVCTSFRWESNLSERKVPSQSAGKNSFTIPTLWKREASALKFSDAVATFKRLDKHWAVLLQRRFDVKNSS